MTTIPVNVSGIVDGQQIDAADVLTPINDLKTAIETAIDGGYDFLKTVWVDAVPLTIASGIITITQTRHSLNNEGANPTDDLVTINGASMDLLILQQANVGQTTTLKHNAGNIWFNNGRDYTINDQNKVVILFWNTTTAKWTSDAVNLGSIWLTSTANVVLSSDSATITQSKMTLVAETGLTDNLATIVNPNSLGLIILLVTASQTITLKHNTGNIFLQGLTDFPLTNALMVLVFNDVTSKWENLVAYSLEPLKYRTSLNTSTSNMNILAVPPDGYTIPATDVVQLEYIPRLAYRRHCYEEIITGTTLAVFAMATTVVGTPSANPTAARQYITMTAAAATVGTYASRRSNNVIFQWRWSPSFEAVVATIPNTPADQDNNPVWFGFATGAAMPTIAAGPVVTYVAGFSGIIVKPYASGGTLWAGQVWSAGVKLGQVLFGTSSNTQGIPVRIWIDGTGNNVVFEANNERSAILPITPGALASVSLDIGCWVANRAASAIAWDYSMMYGEER